MLINVETQIYRVDQIYLTLIKDVISAIEVPLMYKRKLFFYLGENSNSNSTKTQILDFFISVFCCQTVRSC